MIVFGLLDSVLPVSGLLQFIESFSSKSIRGDQSLDSWSLLSLFSGGGGESPSNDGFLN